MEQLFADFYRLLERYAQFTQMRYLYDSINWNNRLILIRGPKGAGKTTMLMQHIQRTFPDKSKVLYCSVDHLWFASHSLLDLAEYAYTHDISHLFFDEIHKYKDWSREIKNIYDSYPALHVVITGSNALEISRQKHDLSRRCDVYTMHGMSFREYLKLEGGSVPLGANLINLRAINCSQIKQSKQKACSRKIAARAGSFSAEPCLNIHPLCRNHKSPQGFHVDETNEERQCFYKRLWEPMSE